MLKKAGTYGLSILLVLSMVLNVTRSVWASDVEAGTGGEGWTSAPTGETSEPSDPSQPVDTSDPTDPSEPVDTSDPTDPSEPVDPSDPTNPTEPTTQPTEPTTKPTEPTTRPTEPTTQPTEPTTRPTEPTKPTEPTTKPTEEELNRTQLQARIQEARKLEEKVYTQQSWEALETALEAAESALDSDSQSRIDKAEQSLRQAISSLVKLDYTQLQAALEKAEAQCSSTQGQLWQKLLKAAQESGEFLESRDQKEIDAAAKTLQELLEQLAQEPQPTEPEQTEPSTQETTLPEVTEAPAKSGGAGAWPVFFVLSLLGNAGLVGWILWSRRNKSPKEEAVFRDIELEEDEE